MVGLCINNDNERFDLSKYIYDNFNTKESYNIYLSLLLKQKYYTKLKDVVISSCYCDKVYKAEVIYWFNKKKQRDLLEFISNISIKNFVLADVQSEKFINYRLALLNFESTRYDTSYNLYLDIVSEKNDFIESPLFNRNISYLMYVNRNYEYRIYFENYKKMIYQIGDNYEN